MSNTKWCDLNRIAEWSNEEICDYYDNKPNLTMSVFAGMLGLSVGELKDILNYTPAE